MFLCRFNPICESLEVKLSFLHFIDFARISLVTVERTGEGNNESKETSSPSVIQFLM